MFRPRAARREDHAAFQKFWGELGTDQRPFELDVWDETYRPYTTFLESATGELVAYALALSFGTRGDVRQIVVDPAFRGQGVGKQIMAVVASQLREAGCRNWRLEVRTTNEPAIALYKSVGMDVIHEESILRIARADAERFAATRTGAIEVIPVEPADDAELEAHFDMGTGQLARYRTAHPTWLMWQVRGVALATYAEDFVPELSLLSPFRAPDSNHAAHLIARACEEGMRAHVEICAVDAPVTQALIAAGARLHDELLEMGGPL